jgi:hypothetical protein
LKSAFYAGAVSEPISPQGFRLIADIEKEVLAIAELLITKKATLMAYIHWAIASGMTILACLMLWQYGNNKISGAASNYVLLLAMATAVSGVLKLGHSPISDITQFSDLTRLYTHPMRDAIAGIIVALAIALCIQNKLITLQVGGSSIDISHNTLTALAFGSLLGFGSPKALVLIMGLVEKVFHVPRVAGSRSPK